MLHMSEDWLNKKEYVMEELIIDWELSQKLAGNNLIYAKEFLTLFIKNLPQDLDNIKRANDTNTFTELKNHIHKLLGALSYTGIPRLKTTTCRFYDTLKKGCYDEIPLLFAQLEGDINNLILHYTLTRNNSRF